VLVGVRCALLMLLALTGHSALGDVRPAGTFVVVPNLLLALLGTLGLLGLMLTGLTRMLTLGRGLTSGLILDRLIGKRLLEV